MFFNLLCILYLMLLVNCRVISKSVACNEDISNIIDKINDFDYATYKHDKHHGLKSIHRRKNEDRQYTHVPIDDPFHGESLAFTTKIFNTTPKNKNMWRKIRNKLKNVKRLYAVKNKLYNPQGELLKDKTKSLMDANLRASAHDVFLSEINDDRTSNMPNQKPVSNNSGSITSKSNIVTQLSKHNSDNNHPTTPGNYETPSFSSFEKYEPSYPEYDENVQSNAPKDTTEDFYDSGSKVSNCDDDYVANIKSIERLLQKIKKNVLKAISNQPPVVNCFHSKRTTVTTTQPLDAGLDYGVPQTTNDNDLNGHDKPVENHGMGAVKTSEKESPLPNTQEQVADYRVTIDKSEKSYKTLNTTRNLLNTDDSMQIISEPTEILKSPKSRSTNGKSKSFSNKRRSKIYNSARSHNDNQMHNLNEKKILKLHLKSNKQATRTPLQVYRLSKRNPRAFINDDAVLREEENNIIDNSKEKQDKLATEDNATLKGLTNKLSYNEYVNGYKYYLKYQKEHNNHNFSDLVRYQAHRQHSVDDIGKYILNKIPVLSNVTRNKRCFFDDTITEDRDDLSTKSDDSWFKKHFYFAADYSETPKYHATEIVTIKSPVTRAINDKAKTKKQKKKLRDGAKKKIVQTNNNMKTTSDVINEQDHEAASIEESSSTIYKLKKLLNLYSKKLKLETCFCNREPNKMSHKAKPMNVDESNIDRSKRRANKLNKLKKHKNKSNNKLKETLKTKSCHEGMNKNVGFVDIDLVRKLNTMSKATTTTKRGVLKRVFNKLGFQRHKSKRSKRRQKKRSFALKSLKNIFDRTTPMHASFSELNNNINSHTPTTTSYAINLPELKYKLKSHTNSAPIKKYNVKSQSPNLKAKDKIVTVTEYKESEKPATKEPGEYKDENIEFQIQMMDTTPTRSAKRHYLRRFRAKNEDSSKPVVTENETPKHFFTTPVPMESNEFDKFLKEHHLDVASVTSPMAGIAKTDNMLDNKLANYKVTTVAKAKYKKNTRGVLVVVNSNDSSDDKAKTKSTHKNHNDFKSCQKSFIFRNGDEENKSDGGIETLQMYARNYGLSNENQPDDIIPNLKESTNRKVKKETNMVSFEKKLDITSKRLLKSLKKFLGQYTVSKCRCRENHPLCPMCASCEKIMSEIIFAFNNLADYINSHCSEVKYYFWVNPSGGRKLRASVLRIAKVLDDYFKRVKGKCQEQTCNTFCPKRNAVAVTENIVNALKLLSKHLDELAKPNGLSNSHSFQKKRDVANNSFGFTERPEVLTPFIASPSKVSELSKYENASTTRTEIPQTLDEKVIAIASASKYQSTSYNPIREKDETSGVTAKHDSFMELMKLLESYTKTTATESLKTFTLDFTKKPKTQNILTDPTVETKMFDLFIETTTKSMFETSTETFEITKIQDTSLDFISGSNMLDLFTETTAKPIMFQTTVETSEKTTNNNNNLNTITEFEKPKTTPVQTKSASESAKTNPLTTEYITTPLKTDTTLKSTTQQSTTTHSNFYKKILAVKKMIYRFKGSKSTTPRIYKLNSTMLNHVEGVQSINNLRDLLISILKYESGKLTIEWGKYFDNYPKSSNSSYVSLEVLPSLTTSFKNFENTITQSSAISSVNTLHNSMAENVYDSTQQANFIQSNTEGIVKSDDANKNLNQVEEAFTNTSKLCDLKSTMDHIQEMNNKLDPIAFEKLATNIKCRNFITLPKEFNLNAAKNEIQLIVKPTKWNWIRNKRSIKGFYKVKKVGLDAKSILDDDESFDIRNDFINEDDGFETFDRDEHGIYRASNYGRRKRKVSDPMEVNTEMYLAANKQNSNNNEKYVNIGDNIRLDCHTGSNQFDSSPESTKAQNAVTWRFDRKDKLNKNVLVDGSSILIHNFQANNSGDYICCDNNTGIVYRNVKLIGVVMPNYEAVKVLQYNAGDTCDYQDLLLLKEDLSNLMSEKACPKQECSIRIEDPVCLTDKDGACYSKATLILECPRLNIKCDSKCYTSIQKSLASLCASNAQTLASIADSPGHVYHRLVSKMTPRSLVIVTTCPDGYHLISDLKICAASPTNGSSSKDTEATGSCKHERSTIDRYDWMWYPTCGYALAVCVVFVVCCVASCVAVTVRFSNVCCVEAPRARQRTDKGPMSPSRVILTRFFKFLPPTPKTTDSQILASRRSCRRIPPPLPPVDFSDFNDDFSN